MYVTRQGLEPTLLRLKAIPHRAGLEELLANLEGTPFDTITEKTERQRPDAWLNRLP